MFSRHPCGSLLTADGRKHIMSPFLDVSEPAENWTTVPRIVIKRSAMDVTLTQQTPFNPTQLHLLKMFAFTRSEAGLDELKSVLLDFYQKKLDDETDRLWDDGTLNNQVMEDMLNSHSRVSCT
jgi:hypothetical protein